MLAMEKPTALGQPLQWQAEGQDQQHQSVIPPPRSPSPLHRRMETAEYSSSGPQGQASSQPFQPHHPQHHHRLYHQQYSTSGQDQQQFQQQQHYQYPYQQQQQPPPPQPQPQDAIERRPSTSSRELPTAPIGQTSNQWSHTVTSAFQPQHSQPPMSQQQQQPQQPWHRYTMTHQSSSSSLNMYATPPATYSAVSHPMQASHTSPLPASPRSKTPLPAAPQQPYQHSASVPMQQSISAYEAYRSQQQQQQGAGSVPTLRSASPWQPDSPVASSSQLPIASGPGPASSLTRDAGSLRRSLPQPPSTQGAAHAFSPMAAPQTPIRSRTLPMTPPASGNSTPVPLPPAESPATLRGTPTASFSIDSVSSGHAPASSSCSSTLTRSDSVRLAAEELMSRGSPKRGGGRAPIPSRFNRSPLAPSSSNGSVMSASSSVSSQSSARSLASSDSRASMATSAEETEPAAGHMSTKWSAAEAPKSQQPTVAVAPSPVRVLPQRPPSRARAATSGSQCDYPPASSHTPATFEQARRDVAQEVSSPSSGYSQCSAPASSARRPLPQVTASLAPGNTIIRIKSPPPNAAPPVSDWDDGSGPSAGPVIAISAPEEEQEKTPPAISVSGSDGSAAPFVGGHGHGYSHHDHHLNHHSAPSAPMGISISHSSDHVPALPQRVSSHMATVPSFNSNWSSSRYPYSPATASSVAGTMCGTCDKYIAGRVVQAMNQSFHPDCFGCNHCSEKLEHVAFYEHEGKAYCHFDYHELFSLRCFHCRTPIVDEKFIQINDPELVSAGNRDMSKSSTTPNPSAATRYYHDLHFFCANCGDPFLDPKVASSTAGSERGKMTIDPHSGQVLSDAKNFVVHKGYPYCQGCHHSLHKPKCQACKGPILDEEYVTAPSSTSSTSSLGSSSSAGKAQQQKYHRECFVCERCHHPFPDERIFVVDVDVDVNGNQGGVGNRVQRKKKQQQYYDEECYKVWLRNQI